MAKKFSELPAATLLDGTEEVPLLQAGTNKRASLNLILSLLDDVLDALEIYDIGGAYNGTLPADAVIVRFVAVRAIAFSDDFLGSVGTCGVAASDATSLSVRKNGIQVGTIAFAAGAASPAFATTGTLVALAVGDVLTVVAPNTPDSTLKDIAFTLTGRRA